MLILGQSLNLNVHITNLELKLMKTRVSITCNAVLSWDRNECLYLC